MEGKGVVIVLYTPIIALLSLGCLVMLVTERNLAWLGGLVFVIYFLPPISHRIHSRFFPLKTGLYNLSLPKYSPWWGSHQIQLIYIALPALEGILRLFPGVYSFWLRLWGSKIGKGIHWTPRVEIVDRGLLEIGNGCVFGHFAGVTGHVIDVKPDGSHMLYLKKVVIGDNVFIGAECVIPPGCKIDTGVRLEARAVLKVNEHVTDKKS